MPHSMEWYREVNPEEQESEVQRPPFVDRSPLNEIDELTRLVDDLLPQKKLGWRDMPSFRDSADLSVLTLMKRFGLGRLQDLYRFLSQHPNAIAERNREEEGNGRITILGKDLLTNTTQHGSSFYIERYSSNPEDGSEQILLGYRTEEAVRIARLSITPAGHMLTIERQAPGLGSVSVTGDFRLDFSPRVAGSNTLSLKRELVA